MKENKKKMPLPLKIVLIIFGIIAGLVLAGFVWLQVNRDKIVDEMIKSTSEIEDYVGADVPAFEVETPDGTKITPDTLLEGKELAAVVLYASWCGPCKKEFPEMDAVYQKYQDKMGMVAIDVDSLDDMDAVKKFGEEYNLSFPLACGVGNKSLDFIQTASYPTTLIIDRNGKICFWRVGSIPSEETFEEIVTAFMGDDYTEKHPAYITFLGVPDVEFTVTTENGTETYMTGEDGSCSVFFEERADMPVRVVSVPEEYKITNNGEMTTGLISAVIKLPVEKK